MRTVGRQHALSQSGAKRSLEFRPFAQRIGIADKSLLNQRGVQHMESLAPQYFNMHQRGVIHRWRQRFERIADHAEQHTQRPSAGRRIDRWQRRSGIGHEASIG